MSTSTRTAGKIYRLLAFFLAFPLLAACPLLAADDKPTAIVHGTLIDGLGGSPLDDATVILRGTKIEYAGPGHGASVPADARIIDAKGRTVMPGLADLHVHLQGAWDGIGVDLLGYQRYFNALLYAGVMTVLDTGNYQPWVLQLRQEQAAGRLLAPRIYCVGAMLDGTDPAWPDLAYAVTSRFQIPMFVERDKQAHVDMIKAYANLSDRLLRRLSEEAAKAGLRVVIDQWDRNGSPDLSASGISGYAHAATRKMSAEDVQLIKDRNLFVITTLVVHESFARTRFRDSHFLDDPLIADTTPPWFLSELRDFINKPQTDDDKKATAAAVTEFEESKRNVKKFFDAHIPLASGTDAPYPGVFQGEGIHHELELLVEAGLTPLQALRMATYDAARIMKAENDWGSLVAGRRANVLIVAGHPAERISDSRKIETVIFNGKILDRAALRFDPQRDPGFRVVPGLFNP
jgi:imidazolonepropionase-like amidohydrolase